MMSTMIYKIHMTSWLVRLLLKIYLILFFPAVIIAAENPLPDATLENRAQALFAQVRCMVCQGEVIKESNAELAVAMRTLIREQLANGWHDEQIIAYLVERYGMQVITKPALNSYTAILWLLPWILLLWGVYFAYQKLRITHD